MLALEMLKVPENITEAVKIALFVATSQSKRLTPIQVKEQAEQRGFDFSDYTNPMASIHSILKRMKDADPPEASLDEDTGTWAYLGAPVGITDDAFYEKLNELAWVRVLTEQTELADHIATDTLNEYMQEITEKPIRKR